MSFDPATRHQPCRDADEAIRTRQSIRAFLPDKPVPRATVEEILRVAARAPSGTNIQPWKVHVLAGAKKAELTRRILAAFDDPEEAKKHTREYAYYPEKWVSPYVDRRRKIGWDMYGLLGIGKGDFAKTHAQHARNYMFFDAPVGMMITMDRIMERGSLIDVGMFLQSLMVAARARWSAGCRSATRTRRRGSTRWSPSASRSTGSRRSRASDAPQDAISAAISASSRAMLPGSAALADWWPQSVSSPTKRAPGIRSAAQRAASAGL